MAVAPRANPADHFSPDEWAALTARSSWRGLWLVAHCWGVIGGAMVMGVLWPVTLPLAVLIIGTRQLGLFILMHDGAHGLLHANRRVNDALALWFCSATLHAYRPYHLQHHRYVQQAEDPDLGLSAPFPITRESLRRKMLRDVTGQTFYKQRIAPLLSDLRTLGARRVDGVPLEAFALWRVTVDTVQIGGRRKESHRVHELFHGNPFEHLDVLEYVLGHQRLLFRPGAGNLTVRRSGNQQTHEDKLGPFHFLEVALSPTPKAGSLMSFL